MTVGKKKKAREEEKYVMLKGDDEIGYGEGVVCKPLKISERPGLGSDLIESELAKHPPKSYPGIR